MRSRLIVFAKAPIPGRVKTRLTPPLTPGEAAQVHVQLVEKLWAHIQPLAAEVDLELHTDQPTAAWPQVHPRRIQCNGDLGTRMLHALEFALSEGCPKAMVLGSDLCRVPLGHLRMLLASHTEVALGPTEDGGYYAISCSQTDGQMFAGVPWSTPEALGATITAATACGLSVEVGPGWFDVDTMDDLARCAETG